MLGKFQGEEEPVGLWHIYAHEIHLSEDISSVSSAGDQGEEQCVPLRFPSPCKCHLHLPSEAEEEELDHAGLQRVSEGQA